MADVNLFIRNCISSNGSDYDMARLLDALLVNENIQEKRDYKTLSNFLSITVHDSIKAYYKSLDIEKQFDVVDVLDKLLLKLKTRRSKDEIIKEHQSCF